MWWGNTGPSPGENWSLTAPSSRQPLSSAVSSASTNASPAPRSTPPPWASWTCALMATASVMTFLPPGWTDYHKRVYYRTYDVTKLIRRGDNALGAMLADGWFSGYIGFQGDRELYGKYPRVGPQLPLEVKDRT